MPRRWPMSDDLGFFFLLISNGLLTGLMYSLIALGFVLVYKATDAINFAQGEFVMIAGFVAAGCLMVWGAPLWLAVTLAVVSLVVFGFVLERYFGVAWAMTGMVSALGGILWGNLLGVDVNLALVGFKVFPVVILGGLDSIPGAIIGGLIVG